MSPPPLSCDTLPHAIFFIAFTLFGNDLVYVLVYFLFLCFPIECKQKRIGGGLLPVLFDVSSLAPMTALIWWQVLDAYLWNE